MKGKIIHDKNNLILIVIYTILLLFFCSKMSPLYPLNDWSDVNIYFNIGKAIFEGRTPYTEAFDHKGPLIFFIYGIGSLISHTSFLGMFLLETIGWIIMLFTIYFTARIFLHRNFAIIVPFIFPLFIFPFFGAGGSAEEFILICEIVSLYFFINYFRNTSALRHPPLFMLIHGIMCSMAFFIKLNLMLFWFFPLLGIIINLLILKQYRNVLANILYFTVGFLIIALPIIVYFLTNNALKEAYDVYIELNSKYASIPESIGDVIKLLVFRVYKFAHDNILSTVILVIGIFYFPIRYISNKIGRISFILCGISLFVIISFTRSFFGYYNLPFLVFNTLGWIAILLYLQKYIAIAYSRKLVILLSVFFLLCGINEKRFYNIGIGEMFRTYQHDHITFDIWNIMKKEKDPTLLNLGFGYGNAVFTVGNISPTLTYFISPNVPHYLYPDMRDQQTKYIENKEVDFIILTNFSMNYDYFNQLVSLKNNYSLVGTFKDSTINDGTNFYTYFLYKKND